MKPRLWIEKAVSGRSGCQGCGYYITKGDLRLKWKRGQGCVCAHVECFGYYFKAIFDPSDIRRFSSLTKEEQERVTIGCKKYYEFYASLKLPKHIKDMSLKQLQRQLRKRDLNQNGKNVDELKKRLKDFLELDDIIKFQKDDYNKLCVGYIKKIEKRYKTLTIPQYLTRIIIAYYPLCAI